MANRISTKLAPAAIGPYSQGVEIGNFLFISGQLPVDPATGAFAADDVQGQTRQSLTNISKILEAAGLSMDNVVKTTVFIQHMDDFAQMNEVYARFFTGDVLPARSAVEVAKLPKGALVEIEAIAARLTPTNKKETEIQKKG